MKPKVTVTGVEDVHRLLTEVSPREAKNLLRATVHGVAGTIRNDAKKEMPEDDGDMKRGTKAKRERGTKTKIESTVRVAGAFYWRFLEYGQGNQGREYAFFGKAVEKARSKLEQVFVQQFGKKWEAALKRAAKRNGG